MESSLFSIRKIINCKQIFLCGEHYLEFELSVFSSLSHSKLNRVLLNILKPKLSYLKMISDGNIIQQKKKKRSKIVDLPFFSFLFLNLNSYPFIFDES
jgi:hypothetical protein